MLKYMLNCDGRVGLKISKLNEEKNKLALVSLHIDNEQRARKTAAPRGFHQPSEGQSLLSFLSSQDFHTCTDLDRVSLSFLLMRLSLKCC